MPSKKNYIQTVGRRREAAARVRLYAGKKGSKFPVGAVSLTVGEILVNGKKVEQYFPTAVQKSLYRRPFIVTKTLEKFAVSAKILGGGVNGQLEALVHGIARAIEKTDKEKYRLLLKKAGLLTRDARVKERRKAGYAHKARARKQSPKR